MNRAPVLAALLVLATIVGAVGAAGAASTSMPTRQADLVIQQPSYVEESVRTATVNGSRVYRVQGESLDIKPQNFNSSEVVDAGVETSAGELSYAAEMGIWRFNPGGETGTFRVYWVVREPVQVQTAQNNTTTTTTEMRQVKYVATLRVEGQAALHHLTDAEYQERQHYAELGKEVNTSIETIRDRGLPFARDKGSDFEIYQSMVDRFVSTGDPVAALSGNYTSMWMLALLTLGGFLFLLTFLGPLVFVLFRYYKQRNERATVQALEGDLDAKQVELEDRERLQQLANMDWSDIFADDHVAHAFREHLGETVLDGWMSLNAALLPRHVIRDRLQAMGQHGYAAEWTDYDEARLVEADPESDEDFESLRNPDDELLDAIDWDDPLLRSFDLGEADVDLSALDTELETLDLETLIDELDTQMRHFDEPGEYGVYLREFVESVREHPFTDEQGRPDDVRYAMSCWLKTAQLLGDRHHFPAAEYLVEAIEGALGNHDLGQQAEAYVDRVQSGGD